MMEYVPLSPIINGQDLAAFLHDMHSKVQISGEFLVPSSM